MLTRALFTRLSDRQDLRRLSEHSAIGSRVSRRFVAGTSVREALDAAARMNALGASASLDYLGENVRGEKEAIASADVYRELLHKIASNKIAAHVSLKLTQMGLDIDAALARELVGDIVARAAALGGFVRVDMEGSAYTQRTLDLVREVHRTCGNSGRIGAVVQSYLRRSEQDVRDLLQEGIRIRLCKGAYQEPASIAFAAKREVDDNFVRLMKLLLTSGVYHGIATHDPHMIERTIGFACEKGLSANAFEFQMLYGIRRDLQAQLLKQGWRVRIYIPFGSEWYPYFMRRLAERPANALFLAGSLLHR
jgi:proline dehydrogenase